MPEPDDLTVARVGIAAFAVFALWRVTLGVDFGDGSHAVGQAVRLATGDVPLVDEMNLQVNGAFLAAPFTWVWRQFAGVSGLVLASRVWYLVLAAGAGWLAARAWRTRWPAIVAITAATVALVPTPYNLYNVSYNTIPGLGLLVTAAAGFAAVETAGRRWAVVCGLASVVAVFAHPAVLPGTLVMLATVVVMAERQGLRPISRAVVASAGGLALLTALWMTLFVGWDEVRRTLRYTADYHRPRASPPTRLRFFVEDYVDALLDWRYVLLAVLVITAVAAPIVSARHRLGIAAALAIPVAVALPGVELALDGLAAPGRIGVTIGTYTTIVVGALCLPVVLWSRRTRERPLNRLLLITLPSAMVNLPVLAMATSASAFWGSAIAPLVPLLGALVIGLLLMAREVAPPRAAVRATALALLVLFAGVQTLYTFRNGTPWNLTERVTDGANAGLMTTPRFVDYEASIRTTVADHTGDGDTVFFYLFPAGYIASTAPMDTNLIWLGRFRDANQETIDWFDRTNRHPDVVFIPEYAVEGAGGWDRLAAEDPLIAYLLDHYSEPEGDRAFYVLRRLPS